MTKAPASKTSASKAPTKPASKTVRAKAGVAAAKKAPVTKSAAPVPKAVTRPAKPQAKAKPAAESREKSKKEKLVRDSFTMPEAEYAVLGEVKKACLKAGVDVKKSELLRVGVALIRQLDTARLKEILGTLPTLKTGRPKKSK